MTTFTFAFFSAKSEANLGTQISPGFWPLVHTLSLVVRWGVAIPCGRSCLFRRLRAGGHEFADAESDTETSSDEAEGDNTVRIQEMVNSGLVTNVVPSLTWILQVFIPLRIHTSALQKRNLTLADVRSELSLVTEDFLERAHIVTSSKLEPYRCKYIKPDWECCQHYTINYHSVREAVAAKITRVEKEDEITNLND